jgi:ketosteroid isomerase-like protein
MSTATSFDLSAFTRATEARDAAGQLAAYADDAELRTVDAAHGPSEPDVRRGRDAIGALLEDVCGRPMTHRVTDAVQEGDRVAFQVACRYDDGTRVLASTVARLRDGRIAEQTTVQAWDV